MTVAPCNIEITERPSLASLTHANMSSYSRAKISDVLWLEFNEIDFDDNEGTHEHTDAMT